ncbi:MAG: branched-chain amino acid ABC transporter permease [Candidatus Nanopelagicales bacterium]
MDFGFILSQSLTQAIGVTAIIYCIAAIGLNIQFGYGGLLNFGQVAFVAVGAYAVGVTVVEVGSSLWLGVAFAVIIAIGLALLLGIPTLRLRADYLAIVTIAASEILRFLAKSADFLGGSQGVTGSIGTEFYDLNPLPEWDRFEIGPLSFSRVDMWLVLTGWTFIAIMTLLTWLLMRSPWGRMVKGIREDEDAVRSLGKNTYLRKLQVLMLGGVFAAFAGVFSAVSKGSVQPDGFVPDFTFFLYVMLILGGTARVAGPLLGAAIFWFLLVFVEQVLKEGVANDVITFISVTQIGPIRFILVGIGLMLLMIFRPQGILGDRKELMLDAR